MDPVGFALSPSFVASAPRLSPVKRGTPDLSGLRNSEVRSTPYDLTFSMGNRHGFCASTLRDTTLITNLEIVVSP
jgi:hypothetical protein